MFEVLAPYSAFALWELVLAQQLVERGALVVQGVWWERGVRPGRRKRVLGEALERYAGFCGAERVDVVR